MLKIVHIMSFDSISFDFFVDCKFHAQLLSMNNIFGIGCYLVQSLLILISLAFHH